MLQFTDVIYQLFMILAGSLTTALLSRLKGMLVSGFSLPIFSCILFLTCLFILATCITIFPEGRSCILRKE